jgi:hypothetical protein
VSFLAPLDTKEEEMIGRRAVVGLALLSALPCCAIAAQSALAAAAQNTTAVTCVKNGGKKDFSDAHCDSKVAEGAGEFGHVEIEKNIATNISITNAKTQNKTTEANPAIFKWTTLGVKFEVTCKTVTGSGSFTNEEPANKVHRAKGSVEVDFTSCTVNKPAGLGCKVKEPIFFDADTETVEGLGAGKNEMGLEFKPAVGSVLYGIVIESCIVAGVYEITGTAIGTGNPAPTERFSGATNVFTNAMTKETLKHGGNPAEISNLTTVTKAGGGNPVALTTTT